MPWTADMTGAGAMAARWEAAGDLEVFAGALSVPGPVRTLNEDAVLISPPVFLVADGMGGHGAGDVASGAVVTQFADLVASGAPVTSDAIVECLERCREAIAAIVVDGQGAPGTTVVSATWLADGNRAYWLVANIGDSRAYLWASGELRRLTNDHSVVQELLDGGQITEAEARSHPERHVITRALGAGMNAPVDFSMYPVEAGSRLLLCSDGVYGPLAEAELAHHLTRLPDVESTASALIDAAVAAGGRDNLSAVVVDVRGAEAPVEEDTVGHPLVAQGEQAR